MTTPISCEAVKKSAADVQSSLKEAIVKQLIEDTNQNINTAVTQGRCCYKIQVPAIIFGYPAYNPSEIAIELHKRYESAGFQSSVRDAQVILKWL